MTVEPRIHIEFAADAPKAVILARGPSRWVHVLLWDTEADSVLPGAWFHGRIYEDGCSLSPDGRLFAYFAMKHHGEKTRGINYAWTAVSRPPWLTALAIWPQEDTWGGRAKFADNETLIIDCPHWNRLHCEDRLPHGFKVLPRLIGKGAPEQELPRIPAGKSQFQEGAGVDQSGHKFHVTNGALWRESAVVVDLNRMSPNPEQAPPDASTW